MKVWIRSRDIGPTRLGVTRRTVIPIEKGYVEPACRIAILFEVRAGEVFIPDP